MGKPEAIKQVSLRDISCLENLVVGYNTVFLMSSFFLVYIAASAHELFADINRLLSPSLLLTVVGVFMILLAGIGYIGIAKQSSTLINIYTQILLFIFALEIAAGMGILSYRGEIRTMVANKMKKSIQEYPQDALMANTVDYIQLEMNCCGVTQWKDWNGILEANNYTECQSDGITLPSSCCRKMDNSTTLHINKRGCLTALSFFLHKSSVFLALGIITISTIQILGTYFAYLLASNLRTYKAQRTKAYAKAIQEYYDRQPIQVEQTINNEKIGYY